MEPCLVYTEYPRNDPIFQNKDKNWGGGGDTRRINDLITIKTTNSNLKLVYNLNKYGEVDLYRVTSHLGVKRKGGQNFSMAVPVVSISGSPLAITS